MRRFSTQRSQRSRRKPLKVFSVITVISVLIFVSAFSATAQSQKFDSNRAWEHLRQLVAIGPRPAGSPAIEQTRSYIKMQLAAAGVPVAEQTWTDQTPVGPVRMVNLIATIPGARKDRLVIAGHYD